MNSINDYIKENYSEKRRIHTEGVRKTAFRLASRFGADLAKADTAALFHDMFRGRDAGTLNSYVERFGMPSRYLDNPNLSHSKIAAEVMRQEYGIKDQDIFNAVSYHTTGRAGMSILEKVIFLADSIEPGRDYPGVKELRDTAEEDIDRACLENMDNTLKYLGQQGIEPDKDTVSARDWLHRKIYLKEK